MTGSQEMDASLLASIIGCQFVGTKLGSPTVAWRLKAKHSPPGGNVFWKSPLWKRGVLSDVAMLPRGDMYKPPVQETIEVKMNAAFTDCQEAKQVSWVRNSWAITETSYAFFYRKNIMGLTDTRLVEEPMS